MSMKTKGAAVAVASVMAAALPAGAMAAPGGGDRGERGGRDGDVPSRVATKLRSAERALDRAAERAEDGNSAGAAASLATVRKGLAGALKAGKRRIVADSETGAPSASAILRTDHKVVGEVTGLLDGADATVTEAGISTLSASIDNRDAVIAAIAALNDRSDYSRSVSRLTKTLTSEAEDISEALEDDELSDAAKAGLTEAKTKLVATAAAVSALGTGTTETGDGAEQAEAPAQGQDGRDCPPGGRGPAGQQQGGQDQQAGQTQTAPTRQGGGR